MADSHRMNFRFVHSSVIKYKTNDLMMTNIHGQLDKSPSADVYSNYDVMFNEIHSVVEKHISSKTVNSININIKIEMDNPRCYNINKIL